MPRKGWKLEEYISRAVWKPELLAKFEAQVAQVLADLERLRAEARVTPVATARPEEEAGNNIEELAVLRREVDQLRRERDVWLGKTHHNRWTRQRQGSSSLVPVGWPLSSTKPMQSEDASTCLPQSPIMRLEEENLNVRTLRCSRRRGIKPRSGTRAASQTVSSSSADTECDPTLLNDFARDLGADVTQRDSSSWSTIPVRSQAVIAVPRPPGSFSSGRFAVLADGEQHDDTPVDPIGPTEPDANSTAVDSVCQESDTESVLSEGISEVPENVGTVGIRQKLLSQSSRHQCRCFVPVPASTRDLYHWTLSMSRISFRGGHV